MEDLFSAIVMIVGGIIAVIASAQKKQKQKQQTVSWPGVNTARTQQSMSAARPQPAPDPKPASMASMLPPAPQTVAQPTVHTHLEPDCDTHDISGSLNVKSPEGKDPCHAQQLAVSRAPLPEEAEDAPALTLDWSGEAMVKAFVMQEVLTRPCQRRAR